MALHSLPLLLCLVARHRFQFQSQQSSKTYTTVPEQQTVKGVKPQRITPVRTNIISFDCWSVCFVWLFVCLLICVAWLLISLCVARVCFAHSGRYPCICKPKLHQNCSCSTSIFCMQLNHSEHIMEQCTQQCAASQNQISCQQHPKLRARIQQSCNSKPSTKLQCHVVTQTSELELVKALHA